MLEFAGKLGSAVRRTALSGQNGDQRERDPEDNLYDLPPRVANMFFTIQNGVARCCCLREAPLLVESTAGTDAASVAVALTNARLAQADQQQQRWVMQVSAAAGHAVHLPLWYDPFAMLGITPVEVRDVQ